jgi:PAS domain S-box-containing protein
MYNFNIANQNEINNFLDVIWDACFIISKEGIIKYINNGVEIFFGYSKSELINNSFDKLLPNKVKNNHIKYLRNFNKDNFNYIMGKERKVYAICKNGTKKHVEIRLSNILILEEKYILISLRDKTDDVLKLENSLKIQTALNIQNIFITHLSHEIRTPINGIIGMTELLKDANDIEKIEYLNTIHELSNTLLSLLNNVLDMSKIENTYISKLPVNLNLLTNHLEKTFKPICKNNGIIFEVINLTKEDIFIGDEVHIKQILHNLINNSIKFTIDGFIKVYIKIEDNILNLKVKDSGMGIPKKEQENLFSPFVKSSSSNKSKYSGFGLGLSICKKIISKMNGSINLESNEGLGTTINCYIPVIIRNLKNNYKGSVVIIEDHKINQYVLQKLLDKLSYKCLKTINNGKEALDELISNGSIKPDVILMDIHIPIIDGYECSAKLREYGINIPIIAVTADVTAIKKIDKKNINDVLLKPFNMEELENMLNKYIV